MRRERFANLTDNECVTLFEALLFCIESGTGIGFRAYDQGHPDYWDGAAGRRPPQHGDTASTNIVFQMIQELSLRIADHPVALVARDYGLTTWEQFCQFANAASEAHQNSKHYVPLYRRGESTT